MVRAAGTIIRGDTLAASFGDVGWVSVLPPESQRLFFAEMSDALLVAATGLSTRNVDLLLGDWKATAESWADPETREQLLAGSSEPLYHVER